MIQPPAGVRVPGAVARSTHSLLRLQLTACHALSCVIHVVLLASPALLRGFRVGGFRGESHDRTSNQTPAGSRNSLLLPHVAPRHSIASVHLRSLV
ncbi:hypothetical protein NDU88_002124 [Pleurodeles waltl]|uniref:Uncharacterized protein n=1 Tax=Pleurodeles waltl TaxID=8319 RepID=A0AAV7NHP3_PLEWA|nr:hypothetical protein NDU88_002124 [Pleurodeles waltl]